MYDFIPMAGNSHWYLQADDLLRQLTPDEVARLESRSLFREYLADQTIYLPEEHSDSVLVLAWGELSFQLSPDGEVPMVAERLTVGFLLGGLPTERHGDQRSPVLTYGPSRVVLVPKEEITRVAAAHSNSSQPSARRGWRSGPCAPAPITSLLYRTHAERLLGILKRSPNPHDGTPLHATYSRQAASLREIARCSRISTEAAAVAAHQLETVGVVRFLRRKIVLTGRGGDDF